MFEEYYWMAFILQGVLVTLQYAILPLIFGGLLGIILAVLRLSGHCVFAKIAIAYVSIIRGTPLLLQLSIIYFAIPGMTGYNITATFAGITAFSINSAAYISEIIRAGINAVDKGQFEAAKALDIPYYLTMRDIILPQAIRNILPSLVNEAIALIKESSIIAVIGEMDIMRRAQLVSAEQYSYMKPMLFAAGCYYVLVIILTAFGSWLERRMHAKY